MAQSNTTAQKGHFPWKHIVGFVMSIVLTLAALWICFQTDFTLQTKIIIIFLFAFLQAALQLLMFMHLTEGKSGRIQAGNILFAAFIAIVVVLGSFWVMNFGVHLNHHM
ncbi:cytochrome aa3 quinol oxidase subunit IV [Aureibacillus halotolerans]|uniref:Quinol oxidase subunit 4 n=1 Tax=Aureibacillus halotolerans TaxID=1508390 RepID=A0A4R6U847_9BACI|nr:cytochrome aa3 quinol oxidase subunit IV [Aureibacillus halotolerans]TDQ42708.1 cytochrome aa3 quinol oxidase subunit 4 [Aureibacillus halotolerans]